MCTRFFAVLAFALMSTVCGNAQPAKTPATPQKISNIAGNWKWKQGAEMLELTLKQDGTKITGYHSAIGQRGAKADEVAPDAAEPSLQGDLKGQIATVQFRTGYPDSTGHGTATLTLRGGYLNWQIVKSDGEHYLPKLARLRREPSPRR